METGLYVAPTGDSPLGRGEGLPLVPSWFLPLIPACDTLVIPVHCSQNC